MKNGKVYLVGAGPGDPGLLTLKGKQVLETADVVVYDRLVGPRILALAPLQAERIYAGKESADHTLSQDRINELLVEKCAGGKVVVRLKGGDPFLFGRGGEEALFLADHGCAFEIVPGVTSAIAAPAYAGIPVTHRDVATSVAFITGHEKPGKAESSIRWHELAHGIDTLVFLMGIENLPAITQNLIAAGRAADTPAALVRCGTLPEQEVLTATLGTIVQKSLEHGMKPPAVLIVGDVVKLRESLAWVEKLPLWGRRIVVTRPSEQSADFIATLQALGAAVLVMPAIEIKPAADQGALHRAFENISAYAWLIFTSRNGVDIFFDELFAQGLDVRNLHGLSLCAIGPATADRLRSKGLIADVVPDDFRAEGLLAALQGKVKAGEKVLLPRAAGSRDVLPEGLRRLSVQVDEINLYASVPPESADAETLQAILSSPVDLITFTSSSTVAYFVGLVGKDTAAQLAARIPAACIGPITAATARENGFTVAVEAEAFTIDGLLEAIRKNLMRAALIL